MHALFVAPLVVCCAHFEITSAVVSCICTIGQFGLPGAAAGGGGCVCPYSAIMALAGSATQQTQTRTADAAAATAAQTSAV